MATQHQDSATNATRALQTNPPVPVQSATSSDIFVAAFTGPTNSTGSETHGPNVEKKVTASKSTSDTAVVPEVPFLPSDTADPESASTNPSTITSCYITASRALLTPSLLPNVHHLHMKKEPKRAKARKDMRSRRSLGGFGS